MHHIIYVVCIYIYVYHYNIYIYTARVLFRETMFAGIRNSIFRAALRAHTPLDLRGGEGGQGVF
jgi:hypothetical protein